MWGWTDRYRNAGKYDRLPLLIGLGCTLSGFLAVAMVSVIQLVSTVYYCRQEVGHDLGRARDGVAELELDMTPVVHCHTAAGTLELPIAGTIVAVLFAAAGIVISGVALTVHLRRVVHLRRAARRGLQ